MAVINITITDKRPTVEGSPVIVCGNSDYTLSFSFDGAWSNTSAKTARFVYIQDGEVKYQDVVFTGTTANVPTLSNIKDVRVGVYAGNLQTSTPAVIPCEYSIRCGTAAPSDPTPSQYDQILALLQQNNAAIAGIQVGGGNRLYNSDFSAPLTGTNWTRGWTTADTTITSSIETDADYGPYIRVTTQESDGYLPQKSRLIQSNHTAGKSYAVSFYAKADTATTLSVGQLGVHAQTFGLTTEWQRYKAVYTARAALAFSVVFPNQSVSISLTRIKFEESTVATDWALAPEETQARILSLEERVAALEASLLSMGGEI